MARLTERDRTLLALRFYENKTGAEAAATNPTAKTAATKPTTAKATAAKATAAETVASAETPTSASGKRRCRGCSQ